MTCSFDVGDFIYRKVYGYGEITTVNEEHSQVFIDFRNGFCDWFMFCDLERSSDVFASKDSFIRVLFKPGDNIKGILNRYSEYRFVDIYF